MLPGYFALPAIRDLAESRTPLAIPMLNFFAMPILQIHRRLLLSIMVYGGLFCVGFGVRWYFQTDGAPTVIKAETSVRNPLGTVPKLAGDLSLSELVDVKKKLENQARFDQGIAYPAIDNTFLALDANWKVTDHLARSLGLSSSERKAAQSVIDGSRDRLKRLVMQNAEYALELSDGSRGISAFRVKPFMRLGHAELEVLDRSLKDNLPTAKADALFRYVRWRPHLGAYGANDVLIVFRKDPDSGAFASAKLTRRNSMTGRVISVCDCGIEQMAEMEGFTPDMLFK